MIRLRPKSHVAKDKEKRNNFKSQHDKGSCDQGLVDEYRNEVATCF